MSYNYPDKKLANKIGLLLTMCGIAGFIDFNQNLSNESLKEMTDVLHHRGPDDSGYSFFET
ncbi:MAG: hypothetical protein V3U71_08460, partial [Cocleimonas sp.]